MSRGSLTKGHGDADQSETGEQPDHEKCRAPVEVGDQIGGKGGENNGSESSPRGGDPHEKAPLPDEPPSGRAVCDPEDRAGAHGEKQAVGEQQHPRGMNQTRQDHAQACE